MKPQHFFIIIASLCIGGIASTDKPHIIYIVADDMGWNDVSFHGANQIPTPNIDALAYNGVILNRHYVSPYCTPSRTSLLTGRYAIREGMQGFPITPAQARGIPLNLTLMPEYLRELGYSTNLVGKWHLGYFSKNHTPTHRGFDSFYGYYNGLITYFGHWIDEILPDGSKIRGYDLHRDTPDSFGVDYNSVYFTDLITDEAEKIIRNNGNKKPLFLEVAHLAVHASEADEPLEVRDTAENEKTFSYIKDPSRRKYSGMMKAMDESVGRIVKALSEANMLEKSIIIFAADNGAPTVGMYETSGSNHPLRGIKGTLFEGAVRGAACIFSPLIRSSSRVSEAMMHISDWLPTLYAAAGGNVANLGNIDGYNQWPTIVNGTESPRQFTLLDIDEKQGTEGAIISRFKLVKGIQEYQDYYGDTGDSQSCPIYRIEDALSSAAGLSIRQLSGFTGPSIDAAIILRKMSTIRCPKSFHYSNCSSLCLFDIENDPCETNNLSRQRPKVVQHLEEFINTYRKVLMPQPFPPKDLCAHPKFFNNTWMPWRGGNISPSNGCQHPVYEFFEYDLM